MSDNDLMSVGRFVLGFPIGNDMSVVRRLDIDGLSSFRADMKSLAEQISDRAREIEQSLPYYAAVDFRGGW